VSARTLPAPLTVAVCLLGALCEGFDVQAAGVAAAGISQQFHPAPGALALFFSAGGAGLLLGAFAGGRISDITGRKAVLVASFVLFGLFSLACAAAPDLEILTLARLLTGLGLGGAMPNLMALTADVSTLRYRSGSIAVTYVGMPLGGAVASLLVFWVPLEAWRRVFLVGAISPLVVAALMAWVLPGIRRDMGSARVAPRVRELFSAGRTGRTLLLWASCFFITLTLYLMLSWLPLLLMGRGVGKSAAALAQAGFNLGGVVLGVWVGTLLDSSWRKASIAGCLIALPVVLSLAAIAPPAPAVLVSLAVLLGGTILASQVIIYAAAAASYPLSMRGTAFGAAVACGRAGSLLGPLYAGYLLATGSSAAQVLAGVLPITVMIGLCAGLAAWRAGAPGIAEG
jgi:MFS transporter, AAHS family, 3-hydroxyphenylpropionic acid transporter